MIKIHPKVRGEEKLFLFYIDKAIDDRELEGYVSKTVLINIYNLFTWVYRDDDIRGAFDSEDYKLYELFKSFNLQGFLSPTIAETSFVFYNKLKRLVDIRKLELNQVVKDSSANKLLLRDDFKNSSLYEIYKNSEEDIPKSFLLFNNIFISSIEKKTNPITHLRQLNSVPSYSALVRPDFSYKLAKKNLLVVSNQEEDKGMNSIYIIQDSTSSMQDYIKKIRVLKAYILDTVFKNNWSVVWIEAGNGIISKNTYNKDTENTDFFSFSFLKGEIDYKHILTGDEFKRKRLVIITDGTDDFDFDFTTISSTTNIITFNENYKLKNKIGAYGKYYLF